MLVPWRVPERSIPDCAIPKPAPNVSGNSWRKILVEGSRGYIGQVEDKVLFFFFRRISGCWTCPNGQHDRQEALSYGTMILSFIFDHIHTRSLQGVVFEP